MDTAIATKFIKTLSVAEAPSRGRVQAPGQGTKDSTPPTDTFKVGTELMHGGQGKLMSTTNLTIITDQRRAFEGDITDTTTFSIRPAVEGLAPPTLEDTNKEVTGDDKKRLRKQNKRRKQHLMAELFQYQKYAKMSSSKKSRGSANWGYLSDSTIQSGLRHRS